ncbi:MAG TPA: ThiF family adenylyltransferase, partial [Chthonomonadaceae bacterium]|nr:ThiF family adenylyltransferase [Chthonomonadaceae bacterium]
EARTPSPGDERRWSRHVGALDRDTWLRQRSVRITVVGAGRMGSAVATTLARWASPLTLVDADTVELHNLDASEWLLPSDLGQPKSEALARHLLRLGTGAPVEGIVADIRSREGKAALSHAEVVACCVDNDAARGFVGAWARRYGLVLLDLGVGVHRDAGGWRAGGDVRLIVPGDGCLECWGGLADPEARGQAADWRQERAGSLRTLVQSVGHLGLTLLEQLLLSRLPGSAWLRLEIDAIGMPVIRHLRRAVSRECPACQETFQGQSLMEASSS